MQTETITLSSAIEASLGTEDETARAWIGEAKRLEVQLDEAMEIGARFCQYMESGPVQDRSDLENDIRHWRELSKAVVR